MYDLCFRNKIISLYGEFILYWSSQGKTDLISSVIGESNDSKGRKRPKIRDKVYRETDLVQQYPILIDIFLDNDIINFILCDSIDMFIGSVIIQF